jgi:hypothetical protein
MKKLLLGLFFSLSILIGTGYAQNVTATLKQGFVIPWKDGHVKNLTTIETLRTKAVEGWGKWNMLVDGWTVDAGYAYDASTSDVGALLIGRQFGTLGKYLPFLDFPLADKITITIYPVGLYINNLKDKPQFNGCSGGAFIRLTIQF